MVSRVLKRVVTTVDMDTDTRQPGKIRVQKPADSPDFTTRLHIQMKEKMLGMIVFEDETPFLSNIIESVNRLIRQDGWSLLTGFAPADPSDILLHCNRFTALHGCHGLFLLGNPKLSGDSFSELGQMSSQTPLVRLCSQNTLLAADLPSVGTDNRKGAWLALEYLASLGHRQIAFIRPENGSGCSDQREVYLRFMRDRFGGISDAYDLPAEQSLEGGHNAASLLFNLSHPPTALFTTNDMMAIGAIRAAHDREVLVPRQISIIGYDDIGIAPFLIPSLTTIRQPVAQIAFQAFALMKKLLSCEALSPTCKHILIEPTLVLRDSCSLPL